MIHAGCFEPFHLRKSVAVNRAHHPVVNEMIVPTLVRIFKHRLIVGKMSKVNVGLAHAHRLAFIVRIYWHIRTSRFSLIIGYHKAQDLSTSACPVFVILRHGSSAIVNSAAKNQTEITENFPITATKQLGKIRAAF
jgi:hypothetical protein